MLCPPEFFTLTVTALKIIGGQEINKHPGMADALLDLCTPLVAPFQRFTVQKDAGIVSGNTFQSFLDGRFDGGDDFFSVRQYRHPRVRKREKHRSEVHA